VYLAVAVTASKEKVSRDPKTGKGQKMLFINYLNAKSNKSAIFDKRSCLLLV